MGTAMSQITPQAQAQLMQLRDIDLPPLVHWWPLATGWWVLFALVLITLGGLCVVIYRRARSRRHQALLEISQLRASQQQLSTLELATELSILLHRFVIAQHQASRRAGNHPHPAMGGEAWKAYLCTGNSHSNKAQMDSEIAAFIALAPYCNAATADQTAQPTPALLLSSTERWIRRYR